MGRVDMVAVDPYTTGFDSTSKPISSIVVASPYRGAQAVRRGVGKCERLFFRIECCNCYHGSENLLLKDAHLVVAFEHRWLNEEASTQVAAQVCFPPAGE